MTQPTNPRVQARIEAEKAAVERLRRLSETKQARIQINTSDLQAALRLHDLYERQAERSERSTDVLRQLDAAVRTGTDLSNALLCASAHLETK